MSKARDDSSVEERERLRARDREDREEDIDYMSAQVFAVAAGHVLARPEPRGGWSVRSFERLARRARGAAIAYYNECHRPEVPSGSSSPPGEEA